MLVTIIIPVYNAAKYLKYAVHSALHQLETTEVLLIEDGSSDNSLQVCTTLAEEHPRVRLLRHADGGNHGAGASRNLGIRAAQCDYIAFLDADDYFLPERFKEARRIFAEDPLAEGVYEAVGYHYEDETFKEKRYSKDTLTTMRERVPPDQLFEKQTPVGDAGYCPTDGWVLKKSVFEKSGLFEEHLHLHQDTVMWVKLAAVGRMLPGRLDEAVAIRRIHASNRSYAEISAKSFYENKLRMWETLWRWGRIALDRRRQQILLRRFLGHAARPYREADHPLLRRRQVIIQMLSLLSRNPSLLSEKQYWQIFLSRILPHAINTR